MRAGKIRRPRAALIHRGNAFLARGAPDQAITSYKKAIKFNPHIAELHNNLGCALAAQGWLADAAASFRQALKLKQDDYADAHSNLGNVLRELGLLIESESSLRGALKLKPDDADTLSSLGVTLSLQGRFHEAETCYRRILEINPYHADALAGMGDAASHWGRFDEADAYFQRALAVKPKMSSAISAIVNLRKMTADDSGLITSAEELVHQRLTPAEESPLRFAMGKYYDDMRDFDRAFRNYRRANELLKTGSEKYDGQMQVRFVDASMQFYGREQMSQAHDGASASARPVFIVGMMRSGTSLTEQIIASHPAAFGAGELIFWNEAFKKHREAIFHAANDAPMLRELSEQYLLLLSGLSADAMRVVDKMPGNFLYLGLIHTVFPNARIIHMRRNPIDTCLSIYFQNFARFKFAADLSDLAHYYRQYHRLMAHWRAVLPPGVLLDVPYEALVTDQESWSRKIIEFIDLDWDKRCLDFHKTERKVSTVSAWQVRQKMYTGSVERWRNYEQFVGPLMELMDLRS